MVCCTKKNLFTVPLESYHHHLPELARSSERSDHHVVVDPPGSKPIILDTGSSTATEEVPAVSKTLTLDLSADELTSQRSTMIAALAPQFGGC